MTESAMEFSSAEEVKKKFEEVYIEIYRKRFYGLPIANHFLSVRVVGLSETDDFFAFCLITPWMLNQIVVPKKEMVNIQEIENMRRDRLGELGDFFVTNVISPMDQFVGMEEAVEQGERQAERLFHMISKENKEQPEDNSRREFLRKIIPKNP